MLWAPGSSELTDFELGILLGLLANIAVLGVGDDLEWRLQLGSAFIPSLFLAIGIYFCPESPRWLMKHGKQAKAFQAMSRLRAHPIIAVRDYYYSWVIYEEEVRMAAGSTYFTRLWDCFAIPRIRRSNYGASTVMIAQQMCGINSVFCNLTEFECNRSADASQLSLSTAPVSSKRSATHLTRPCMPL